MPHRRAKRPQATDTSRRALRWRRSPRAGDGNRAALPLASPIRAAVAAHLGATCGGIDSGGRRPKTPARCRFPALASTISPP
jgi:hypothetical protein